MANGDARQIQPLVAPALAFEAKAGACGSIRPAGLFDDVWVRVETWHT